MNPERILQAIYEPFHYRPMTECEKAELIMFLEWVLIKIEHEPFLPRTLH